MADPNRDVVRCRWAISDLGECGGICDVFPNATLDEVRSYIFSSDLSHKWVTAAPPSGTPETNEIFS